MKTPLSRLAFSERFNIELPDDCINECSHSGQCDADVEYWKERLNLQLDPTLLSAELDEYGRWSDEELTNHEDNLLRIIWIAAENIKDELRSNKTRD